MDAVTPLLENPRTPVPTIDSANVQELGRDVFLRLLVTQLESQDPTNPVENEDFVAQLAQFTSLEQTTNINENLQSLIGQNDQSSKLDLVNLIGREIVAQGNVVPLGASGDAPISYTLEEPAKVSIEIVDPNGALVTRLTNVGIQDAGAHQVVWDGTDAEEERVAAGTYGFRLRALDSHGKEVPSTTFMRDIVKSVMISETQPLLILGSGKTLLSDEVLTVQAQ